MDKNKKDLVFPVNGIDGVEIREFYLIENTDIKDEKELNYLVYFMFEFTESDFYLFHSKNEAINYLINDSKQKNIIRFAKSEFHYFPHPTIKHDYIKITKPIKWDWEKEVYENSPEYIKVTLKLTERYRRKFELQEALLQHESDKKGESPLVLQPNIYGIGIDIRKALAWLKAKIKRKL